MTEDIESALRRIARAKAEGEAHRAAELQHPPPPETRRRPAGFVEPGFYVVADTPWSTQRDAGGWLRADKGRGR